MDFKKITHKLAAENQEKSRLPSSQFQKRLENLLKSTTFKHLSPQFSRQNLEKLHKSLLPLSQLLTTLKTSVFAALSSKSCVFPKENCRNLRLLRLFLRLDAKLAGFSEKSRKFFQKWRLLSFESSLRNLLIFQSELINKQIISQFDNVFVAVVRPKLAASFETLREFARKQEKTQRFRRKTADFRFAAIILCATLREKVAKTLINPFSAIKRCCNSQIPKKSRRNWSLALFILAKSWKLKKKQWFFEFFARFRRTPSHFFELSQENCEKLALKALNFLTFKEISLKKAAFQRLFCDFCSKTSRNRVLLHILKRNTAKLQSCFFRKWEFFAWKLADPLIKTRKDSRKKPISARNCESIAINRRIMINQAMVNKALEEEQRKKAIKLLNLNKNLGLIEISELFCRKQRLYAKTFLNNFLVQATFDPRRFQEFEDYAKILQEEKVF